METNLRQNLWQTEDAAFLDHSSQNLHHAEYETDIRFTMPTESEEQKKIRSVQQSIPCKGDVPTPEELIAWMVGRVLQRLDEMQ